jgi:hypothetical protein
MQLANWHKETHMPFSGPGTYLETCDEFLGHWTDVNAFLTPDMALPTGYELADLQSDRDDLADEMATLEANINTAEFHRNARDNQEGPLLEDMKQLGAYIRGPLVQSNYVVAIPDLPKLDSGQGVWQRAMDDHASLWLSINTTPPAGFTPPLVLPNTTTQAQFVTNLTAQKQTFEDYNLARQNVDLKLEDRDVIYRRIRENLGTYRSTLLGLLGEDHALVLSCPRLEPLPGHTPDAVVLSGIWNGNKAELSWTESTDVDLDHYSVRRSPSNPYSTATEQLVANVDSATQTLETLEGLEDPGTMRFKVYVVLDTGNERGSNAVEVENPG